jgi:glycosyltransferase involved in cell wall biosynthesis
MPTPKPAHRDTQREGVLSIVIATRNRPHEIRETIRSLSEQPGAEQAEIIVVDDGSDPPLALGGPSNVRVLRAAGEERSTARNLGATSARGSTLLFLDDDLSPKPGFLEAHATGQIQYPDALRVGRIHLSAAASETPFGRFRQALEHGSQEYPAGPVPAQSFCTAANMSIARDRFLSLGGFDPNIVSAEDQDFALRFRAVGGMVVFVPDATVIHRHYEQDIAAYCKRIEWGARLATPFMRRHATLSENIERVRLLEGPAPLPLRLRRTLRGCMAMPGPTRLLHAIAAKAERSRWPDATLFIVYQALLGGSIYRGLRDGLAAVPSAPPAPPPLVAGTAGA